MHDDGVNPFILEYFKPDLAASCEAREYNILYERISKLEKKALKDKLYLFSSTKASGFVPRKREDLRKRLLQRRNATRYPKMLCNFKSLLIPQANDINAEYRDP
ncbi:hypothetical protein CEXT_811291 [Caerostris extrusa]|uniref:Uncharacterized protein n=1 Tax=Caerostris extrusa TaxID=172846 RepID=A0AAV4SIJ9_CAEEX|nr:hypothetical protein CEXT_811291 [Caerostris extrusa]